MSEPAVRISEAGAWIGAYPAANVAYGVPDRFEL